MKDLKLKFVLTRVHDDGSQDAPEIVSLSRSISESKMSRRGFLGAGMTAAAALMVLDGCGTWQTVSTPRPVDRECGKTYAHSDDVVRLAVSADGSMLASGGKDGSIKCWRLSDNALVHTFKTSFQNMIEISPDGTMIAFRNSERLIVLAELPSGNVIKTFQGNCCIFSPDGELLLIGRDKGEIECYRINEETTFTMSAGNQPVTVLAASLKGHFVAVGFGSASKDIRMLDWNGKTLKTLVADASVNALAFSSDERFLAVEGESQATVFRISNEKVVGRWVGRAIENDLIFSPDDELVLSASAADTLSVEQSYNWIKKPVDALSMVFTPDGNLLVTGGVNGSVKIWNWPDLKFLTCLMDINCSGQQQKGVTYNYKDEWGQLLSYTLPCGSPLPRGATCTCNCVPGKLESNCSCNKVCTCNMVCTCQSVGYRQVCTCVPVYR